MATATYTADCFSHLGTDASLQELAVLKKRQDTWGRKADGRRCNLDWFPCSSPDCSARIPSLKWAVLGKDEYSSCVLNKYDCEENNGPGHFVAEQRIVLDSRGARKRTLDQLDQVGMEVDAATYISLLKQCGYAKDLEQGKRIHSYIGQRNLLQHPLLANHLLQMYGKCGALEEARVVFDQMQERNVFAWTIIIGAYGQHGQAKEALELFQQMQEQGVIPDKVAFITILSIYASQAALVEGKQMHACIVRSGFESDVIVGNCLVSTYSKCGNIENAKRIFDKMRERNVVSWNAIITAYAQSGQGKEALQLFHQMQLEQVLPNEVTLVGVLDACAAQVSLAEGDRMHAWVVASGFESNIVVGTALVNMYGQCGSLENGQRTFNKMHKRDVVSWNAMIAAYSQCEQSREALELFQQMQVHGTMPDAVTFVSILHACASQRNLDVGKQMHVHIVANRFESDIFVGNALIDMYGKCGCVEDAQRILDNMPKRNVISWNTMIAAYAQHEKGKKAIQLLQQMHKENTVPNKVTFVSILDACSSQDDLAQGKLMHAMIETRNVQSDVILMTALVNMYGKCGSLEDAQSMFDGMRERNVVSWNALIAAYAQYGQGESAISLFQQMLIEAMLPSTVTFVSILDACASQASLALGKCVHVHILSSGLESDVFLGNSLVNMYGSCGNLSDAWHVFEQMPNRDVVSWNAMIAAYTHHGHSIQALHLFQEMQLNHVMPNEITFVSVLDACSCEVDLDQGRLIHDHILARGLDLNPIVGTALISMYGKCGNLEDAKSVFDKMPKRDSVSWNATIAAYSQQGQGKEALCLFKEMQLQNVNPDLSTCTSILSACSHAGLVDEARQFFESIKQDYGITPVSEHYNIMIDLLGRVGLLVEAEDLINDMPFRPTATSWVTLLGACKQHMDLERGRRAAENILKLDPANSSTYVLLCNIYAAVDSSDLADELGRAQEGSQEVIML